MIDWRARAARPFYLATGYSPMGLRRRRDHHRLMPSGRLSQAIVHLAHRKAAQEVAEGERHAACTLAASPRSPG